MRLKDLCELDVVCCTGEQSIAAAAAMMRQQHTGDLIVVDDNDANREPVGIITDRDIVLEVVAKGLDPARTPVKSIMTTRLVIASASEDVDTAIARMKEHGVRRLPLMDDDGSVLGIVTLDDLLRVHAEQAAALLNIVANEQTREGRSRR